MRSSGELGRGFLLVDPLAAHLAATFPSDTFHLDAEAALHRPGETIVIGWQDGPSCEAVRERLSPRWSTQGGGYPVTLNRTYSPETTSYFLLALSDAGHLQAVGSLNPAELAAVHDSYLLGVSLPGQVSRADLTRARLFAGIAAQQAQPGLWSWAQWSCSETGREVIETVLPATLERDACGATPR